MTHPLASAAALLLVALAPTAFAAQQSCAVFSPEFTGGGFDHTPLDFELFDFGAGPRLVAVGEFTVAGSVQARRVAQWDGNAWSQVGPGFNGDASDVEAIDLGNGPELFATGRFQASDGQSRNRIARWNGTSWVALGSGLNGPGWALCELPTPTGNRLVVGGEFTTAGGQPALRVAQWNGSTWSALGAGIGQPIAAQKVLALAVHDDGNGPALYAAGEFPGGVARFDGTAWSVVGGGLVGTPQSLASYDDGQGNRLLLVGGNFGTGPTSVLKGWNGASWQELGLTNYIGGIERILVRQESGSLAAYLAGSFAPQAGSGGNAALVARWTPAAITPLPPLLERVRAVAFYDGGSGAELLAGGTFTRVFTAPNRNLRRVARLSAGQWLPVEPAQHALYELSSVQPQQGNAVQAWTNPVTGERDLYVGGFFAGAADDPTLKVLARWDGATVVNAAPAYIPQVLSLAEWRPSSAAAPLLVVGSMLGTHTFDGSVWQQLGDPSAGRVNAFVEFTPPGASAPVLHAFGFALGLPNPAAACSAQFDGTNWLPMGLGINGSGNAAVVWDAPGALPEGIFVGGDFLAVEGQLSSGIALWDGSSWHRFPSTGFEAVHDLCVFDDGSGEALFASTNQGLRKFDGTTWTALGPVGSVLVPHDDGSGLALYISDRARLRNGVQESFGSATPGAPFPAAAHSWVDEHGISQGLYFTGSFESLGGIPAMGLARYWNPCGAVSAFCTAKVNSLGCTPQIGWTGTPSASSSAPFVISAANVLNQKPGLFLFGTNGRKAQPFLGGTLCVRAPVVRTPVRSSGGAFGGLDCSGVLSIDFAPYLNGASGFGLGAGAGVQGQWWYRDPLASFTAGLSDAIEFLVHP